MNKIHNYTSDLALDLKNKNIVIVKSAEEIIALKNNYPTEYIKIRLVIASLDEELLELLISLGLDFEIIIRSNTISEREVILLNRYKNITNNKVYIAFNIDDSSLYERSTLIYYINRYGITCLLDSHDENLYKEWNYEMTKYTEKKNVKRLSKTYIGKLI